MVLSETYTNAELPNLRAQFVVNDFVLPFLKSNINKEVAVHILQGFEFSEPDKPKNRMVQIYIRAYGG